MSGFHDEINSNGHILYCYESDANMRMQIPSGQNKILGMDLDWTLIRPIKGKIHPLDEHDWQFLYQKEQMHAISDRIAAGYKLVIFTNQGGLLANKFGKMGVEGFKSRWHIILDRLEKEYNIKPTALIASLYDDFNRKPCCGMWEFLEEMMLTKYDAKIERAASLYVGDMAGRKGDYSASDLLFAMNLGVEFQVPEVFYGVEGSSLASNKTDYLVKQVLADDKLFNPNKPITKKEGLANKRQSKINAATRDEIIAGIEDQHKQSLVIFVGSPASGKSSWYASYLKELCGSRLVYLGMDTFNGTLAKFHKEVEINLKKRKNVIVDNTNGTSKAREKLAALAKGVDKDIQVIVVHFTTDKPVCLHLNALRTKKVNICELQKKENCGHNVPAVAIHTYWKHFEPVQMDKETDIDVVYTLEWEPRYSGLEEKIYRLTL
jgi:bifunctional polynucleotide phosphatase/kinase